MLIVLLGPQNKPDLAKWLELTLLLLLLVSEASKKKKKKENCNMLTFMSRECARAYGALEEERLITCRRER